MATLVSWISRSEVALVRCRKYMCVSRCAVTSVSGRNYSENVQNYRDTESYDIIIVGGGLVGTTLACALGQHASFRKKRILLLESGKKLEYLTGNKYSNRVVALNQHSSDTLAKLGAWKYIEAARFCPVKEMQVWDTASAAVLTFQGMAKEPSIAYIVENDLIIHAVNCQLKEKRNVNVIYNGKVKEVKLSKEKAKKATVTLADGRRYNAELVVGADGINSAVRRAMNVPCLRRDYSEMAIVATLKLTEPTENSTAWQRFLPTGPIALLPLTDSLSSLVWTLPTDAAKRLLTVPEEEFTDEVNRAFWKIYPKAKIVEEGERLVNTLCQFLHVPKGELKQLPPSVSGIENDSRAAFPLGLGLTVNSCASGAVLVGDAIHKVHPLAGQGANLGFGDVTVLVEQLARAARYGCNLGDINNLTLYERSRLFDTIPISLGIHTIHDIYKNTWPPFVAARNLGVHLVNTCQPLKMLFARYASGKTLKSS